MFNPLRSQLKVYFTKSCAYIKTHWLLSFLIIILSIATILYCLGYGSYLADWSDYILKFITPLSVIIGIVLGYPLLKRKLAEKYISKQFELILDANNAVRRKCLELIAKYPVKSGSIVLTSSFISQCLQDVLELRYASIDANPEVYKYVDLIFRCLQKMDDRYSNLSNELKYIHQEELSYWFNLQVTEIFDCSRSIGKIPDGETLTKQRVNARLSKYVSENQVFIANGLDGSTNHFHNSALLLCFFSNNNRAFSEKSWILFSDCFEIVPSPCPFARLLYNNEIYIPPVLRTPDKLLFDYGELMLIGWKKKISGDFSGKTKSYYIFIYYNISHISFVYGTISKLNDLSGYLDGYLNCKFSLKGISEFRKEGEYISFRVDIDELSKRYIKVKDKLESNFLDESLHK